jgi:hypothetical protein
VIDWPVPQNVKELRGFLGLTGYYRRFIKHYGIIAKPWTQVLKRGISFQWTPITQEAFDTLKQALAHAPVLAVPDFQQPFVLETDASDLGIGAVLMQKGHPISYLSQAFSAKNRALSTYEKECMAILLAVEKWRPYLLGQEFVIKTDHKSLLHLTEQKVTSKLQQKALLKLMDLNFKIQYKKGTSNSVADALSRKVHFHELLAVSVCQPAWKERVLAGYLEDPEAMQLLTELSLSSENDKGFSLQDGIIKLHNKVWIGNNTLAQNHIIQALHASGIGGHSGMQACQVCQQAKVEHVRSPGLLQPLPVPSQAWTMVSLDFIEGLPKSGGFDVILVVIDKFSKYAHFIPMSHPYTTLSVAQPYFNNIYKLYRLPEALISDRDKVFTSTLWKELFALSDTQLLMSSPYHP